MEEPKFEELKARLWKFMKVRVGIAAHFTAWLPAPAHAALTCAPPRWTRFCFAPQLYRTYAGGDLSQRAHFPRAEQVPQPLQQPLAVRLPYNITLCNTPRARSCPSPRTYADAESGCRHPPILVELMEKAKRQVAVASAVGDDPASWPTPPASSVGRATAAFCHPFARCRGGGVADDVGTRARAPHSPRHGGPRARTRGASAPASYRTKEDYDVS
jgi:hypothetical protein